MNNDPTLYTTDPYEYLDKEFGKVVPFEVIKANKEAFSEIFSEGSAALKDLLNKMWEQDIRTIGCCVGHKNQEYFYKTDDKNNITFVEKKEYNWHRFSKHYHRIKEDATAYFALDPRGIRNPYELGNDMIHELHEKIPEISFSIGAQDNMVTIYLDEYVPEDVRECFFHTLSGTLDRYLISEKTRNNLEQNAAIKKHMSLHEKISAADNKAQGNQKKDYVKTCDYIY